MTLFQSRQFQPMYFTSLSYHEVMVVWKCAYYHYNYLYTEAMSPCVIYLL